VFVTAKKMSSANKVNVRFILIFFDFTGLVFILPVNRQPIADFPLMEGWFFFSSIQWIDILEWTDE